VSVHFLGITRERVYSPGKVDADREILEAVAAALGTSHRVAVVSGDAPLPAVSPPTVVFAMCQGPSALATLRRWEAAGIRVVNSAAAIGNTQRRRMLEAFERHGIPHPPSVMLSTAAAGAGTAPALPAWAEAGAWLKRGDVHATEPDDVVYVEGRAAIADALAAMHRRGIDAALLQRHVEGDVIKFYAVRGRFFACFPPNAAAEPLRDSDRAALNALAEAGAAVLELEVFGGDCVRDRQGNLSLIDLNDWPSYAPCRSGASLAIASYLRTQTGAS
jgi:hypothetical protein